MGTSTNQVTIPFDWDGRTPLAKQESFFVKQEQVLDEGHQTAFNTELKSAAAKALEDNDWLFGPYSGICFRRAQSARACQIIWRRSFRNQACPLPVLLTFLEEEERLVEHISENRRFLDDWLHEFALKGIPNVSCTDGVGVPTELTSVLPGGGFVIHCYLYQRDLPVPYEEMLEDDRLGCLEAATLSQIIKTFDGLLQKQIPHRCSEVVTAKGWPTVFELLGLPQLF